VYSLTDTHAPGIDDDTGQLSGGCLLQPGDFLDRSQEFSDARSSTRQNRVGKAWKLSRVGSTLKGCPMKEK
jgi:hypothetical protein